MKRQQQFPHQSALEKSQKGPNNVCSILLNTKLPRHRQTFSTNLGITRRKIVSHNHSLQGQGGKGEGEVTINRTRTITEILFFFKNPSYFQSRKATSPCPCPMVSDQIAVPCIQPYSSYESKFLYMGLVSFFKLNDYIIDSPQLFIIADTQLYRRLCPLDRRSIGPW